jgi:hypothetical protein
MAEERENIKSDQVAGRSDDDDVEGHSDFPRLDETDPDELKLKLANDEDKDDDVEAHKVHGDNVP